MTGIRHVWHAQDTRVRVGRETFNPLRQGLPRGIGEWRLTMDFEVARPATQAIRNGLASRQFSSTTSLLAGRLPVEYARKSRVGPIRPVHVY
jgi:hypothetical protein